MELDSNILTVLEPEPANQLGATLANKKGGRSLVPSSSLSHYRRHSICHTWSCGNLESLKFGIPQVSFAKTSQIHKALNLATINRFSFNLRNIRNSKWIVSPFPLLFLSPFYF